jgi:hypothetical protein
MAVVLSEDRKKVLLHRREIFFCGICPVVESKKASRRSKRRCEAREEMGYEIAVERFVGTYTHQSVYGVGDQETKAFRAHVTGGKMKRFGLESTELKWVDIHHLPHGLERLHRQIIADALDDSSMPVDRRIDFSKWKLYPARVVFTIMRFRNYFIRRLLKLKP